MYQYVSDQNESNVLHLLGRLKNVVYGSKMDLKKNQHQMISVIEYPKYNIFLFPGWLFTFEYYFETYSNKIINLMVEQLTKNQAWRFVWSEVCWLDKWWEKASQSQKDSFTRFKGFFFYILLCICRVSSQLPKGDDPRCFSIHRKTLWNITLGQRRWQGFIYSLFCKQHAGIKTLIKINCFRL